MTSSLSPLYKEWILAISIYGDEDEDEGQMSDIDCSDSLKSERADLDPARTHDRQQDRPLK